MIVVFLLLWTSLACAANPFNLGKVDYFKDGSALSVAMQAQEEHIDWREPVMGAGGAMSLYTPPQPVLDLLEQPTKENALRYMKWQRIKMERINKAAALVAQLEQSP